MDSIWTKTASLPAFPTLAGDLKADVAVIGGGLAGILTAYRLRQSGASVVVLEADRVGQGQTGGTTAKLTAQHGLCYQRLMEDLGEEAAGRYARSQTAAVSRLRQLVQEKDISCDFQDCTAFLYTTGAPGPLEREYRACRKLRLDVFLTEDTELPFSVSALGLRSQSRFHPQKLLAALAKDLAVYEHTRVLEAEGHQLRTTSGMVTAQKVVFTCHYPFPKAPGFFFARQHQERSYVLALENAAPIQDMYLGIDENGLSFRSWEQVLLLGGGGHRTGSNRQGGKYDMLRRAARQYWPDSREIAAWSAQDCMPMDGVPYIGSFAESRPDWLVATGFQKWGMSSSVLAADILSALVLDQALQPDWALFSPQRFHPSASAKQMAEDAACSLRGLGRRFLESGRISAGELPCGHGGIVELDGEKLGVYRASNGELFAVTPQCPHLGCQLEWNPDEHSWDCPCHGSRFDVHGRLLDGPAVRDL